MARDSIRGVLGYLATAAGLASSSPLLTATIAESQLTLDYAADARGIADSCVRATDLEGLFAEDTFRVAVTPVNDAPVLDSAGAMTLAAIDEDQVANPGTLVRDILASAGGAPLLPGLRETARLQFHVNASLRDAIPLAVRAGCGVLDIEPVDPWAGGYAWTAVDGSVAIEDVLALIAGDVARARR